MTERAKLSVRMHQCEKLVGGLKSSRRALKLFDDQGRILAGQRHLIVDQPFRDVATVTVTFVIDGHNVKLGEDAVED